MKLIIALALVLSLVASGQESKFVEVRLPHGISIDVPRNWWVISGDLNQTLETSAQAVADLAGVKTMDKVNLFRANSMPRTMYAAISINFYEGKGASPSEFNSLTSDDLKTINEQLHSETEKGFEVQGVDILDWYGTKKDTIGSKSALTTAYRRSTPGKGPVIVQINTIFTTKDMIRLTLSYREAEGVLWKPVIERIRRSFKVND